MQKPNMNMAAQYKFKEYAAAAIGMKIHTCFAKPSCTLEDGQLSQFL
jgi:hypothetical protein